MSQQAHGEFLLEQLRQQRETDFLCDITITVGNVPFRAHRNVLAAFSQFFAAVSAGTQQDMTLHPHSVSQYALEKLLEFVYTGEMSIDSETAEVVRRAAVFLGMSAVEQYMDKVLQLQRSETSNQSEAGIASEPTIPSPQAPPIPPSPPSPEDVEPLPGVDAEGEKEGDEEMDKEEVAGEEQAGEDTVGEEEAGEEVGEEEEVEEVEAEENVDDPEYIPTNPITPSSPQGGQSRKRVRKPKKLSPDECDPTTMSSTLDDLADIKTRRGRGRVRGGSRGRGRGSGRGRVEVKREELSFVDSDLQAIKMGRKLSSDLSPPDQSSPAKRIKVSGGERRGRGKGRSKLKENCASDGEGGEGKAEEGKSKRIKQLPKCTDCNKFFSEDSSLRRHMRIHRGIKPFQCPICPKKFRQANQLKTHLRIHTGEKPFSCTQCDKSFVQKCQLVSHCRQYHGEEKPYCCQECGLQFATSSNFRIHCRLHSGEKPYVCEDCGKAFAQVSTLIYHRRRHTGEKPYQCDTCGMSFSVSSSLIAHKRKHTGEAPYACTHCDKRYVSVSERNKHLRTHVSKGVVQCEFCGNGFVSLKNMLRHQEKLHPGRQREAASDGSSHLRIPLDHQGLISRLVPGTAGPGPHNPELIKRDPSPPNPNLANISLIIPKPDPDRSELRPGLITETITETGIYPDTLRALVEQLQSSSAAENVEQIIIIQTQ